ncbi:GGDEF domain-containing protein [Motiliproteus sediminis]|uniref:GGDEF domain-containing protein n=1 Tax=Motiliproteus sediminis TaxID=1468178 RepID=UPI001AEF6DCA|nr:sensor domain-containing diguanylate cyclase [Motiliproteus sediminis]
MSQRPESSGRPRLSVEPTTPELQHLIHEAIQHTPDGIGIFDPDDRLVYSNEAHSGLFGLRVEDALGLSFEQLVRHAYAQGNGIHIETDNIDDWLEYASSKRRTQDYRSFQTDTLDGRWVHLTEQLLESDHLFVFFTDITQQKRVESKLHQLTCKLKIHAETDDLTGTHNRRHFFELADKELRRCRRNQQPAALLLMDVDHFKKVNDTYGHQQGDRVLCLICRTLTRDLRDYDVLGRIGGEEFALLVPQADKQRALNVAERLRQEVEAIRFAPPMEALRTSLSIGIAVTCDNSEEVNGLISRADKALYAAKHQGRNRSVLADDA